MQFHQKIIDLEQLRCFVVAAQSTSFQQAAKQISLSPQAFGERIRQLESQLDSKLFIRNTRSIQLSPSGKKLIDHAKHLLDMSARSFEMVNSGKDSIHHVKLGTRWELGLSWLQPILEELEMKTPNYRFDLIFSNGADLLKQCKSGELDASISSHRINRTDFNYANLHEESYLFVGHKDLFTDKCPLEKPEDAALHTLLDIHQDLPLFRYFMDVREVRETWRFKRVQQLGTIEAIKRAVLHKKGVAVLPSYFIQKALKAGKLQIICPETQLSSDFFRLIWKQGHPQEADLKDLAVQLQKFPLKE